MPASVSASTSCAAVTPEPQYAPTAGTASRPASAAAGAGRQPETGPSAMPSCANRRRRLRGRAGTGRRAHVGGGRRAQRPGDVAGHRVDWLGLAAVPLPRPGVEQHAGPGQRGGARRLEHRQVTGNGREARPPATRRLVRGDRLAGRGPGRGTRRRGPAPGRGRSTAASTRRGPRWSSRRRRRPRPDGPRGHRPGAWRPRSRRRPGSGCRPPAPGGAARSVSRSTYTAPGR